jgi:chloride channel 2
MLTITNTTLRLPAGFFTPMLMIGAIIGRIFGQCVQDIMGDTATIYVPGYALVGACAFASGTTHTISAAVVMLESTGQISMFLPCLIGAIVGSGFVKGYTVSLYNQGLINKGLESFEQLLLESGECVVVSFLPFSIFFATLPLQMCASRL